MTQTPAGWYPDSERPGGQRYWDGAAWSEQRQEPGPAGPPPPSADTQKPKKKRRIFLWVFLAVQVLFIIWIIGGATSGPDASNCGTQDLQTCKDFSNVGTGIGVVLVIILWAVVDFFMAVIYGVYRLAKRT